MLSGHLTGEHLIFINIRLFLNCEEAHIMVRTRTIKEAAAYFHAEDPQTWLTEAAIRTLLRSGAVPSVRVGKKYLVTVEALEAYPMGETGPMPQEDVPPSKPVKVWHIH